MRMTVRIALLTVLTTALYAAPAKFQPYEFKANDGTVVQAELGEFEVPENRTKPESRKIAIRFVRFKSTSPKPGSPIVYLAGGPGGSGIGAAMSTRFPLFMALREFGDVIAYDQRGINLSGPKMLCTEEYLVDPAKPLERTSYGAALTDAMRRCGNRLTSEGVDLTGYNTVESAADLNDLRLALGAKKLALWGISYGTHLSIAALRYHPDAIDRVILAGIEGPDDTYKLPSDQQTLDGRTRPRQAEELRRMMPNATTLIIEGAGHSDPLFLSSPKIFEAVKAFLRNEPIRERYISLPPITFLPLRTVANVSDDLLARHVGTYRIDEKSTRRIVKAESVLYAIRDGGQPAALRPLSETEFFYEGRSETVRFDKDGMTLTTADGQAYHAKRE
jgi:pimeloyl-ACP methyl ester carboxylesterase